jgi:hypothetical protein
MSNLLITSQPNWEDVMKSMGHANIATTKVCWSRLKRNKLSGSAGGEVEGVAGGVSKTSPSKKGTAKPKKIKGDDDEESPKKRATRKPAAKKAKKEDSGNKAGEAGSEGNKDAIGVKAEEQEEQ